MITLGRPRMIRVDSKISLPPLDDGEGIILATDAAVTNRVFGAGYIATNGLYGLINGRLGANQGTVVAELLAVSYAIEAIVEERREAGEAARPVRILVDSRGAVSFLRAWKSGKSEMPANYPASNDHRRERSELAVLARRLARRPKLYLPTWVRSHEGNPPNELADSLARLALRHLTRSMPKTSEEVEELARLYAGRSFESHPSRARRKPQAGGRVKVA